MRWAVGVEYDGSEFRGFQLQSNTPHSVQQVLTDALSFVANERVTLYCAGRTDAGVHATAQVVHFDSDAPRSPLAWVRGANTRLPKTVRVLWAAEVAADFDARFSARSRRYLYLLDEVTQASAFGRRLVATAYSQHDVALMQEAATHWIGENDFSSFRSASCQARTANRFLKRLQVTRSGSLLIFDVTANAFLHRMVRNLVGTLLPIGRGENPSTHARDVLLARDRRLAGATAPAAGLYLIQVTYDRDHGFPQVPVLPWFLVHHYLVW